MSSHQLHYLSLNGYISPSLSPLHPRPHLYPDKWSQSHVHTLVGRRARKERRERSLACETKGDDERIRCFVWTKQCNSISKLDFYTRPFSPPFSPCLSFSFRPFDLLLSLFLLSCASALSTKSDSKAGVREYERFKWQPGRSGCVSDLQAALWGQQKNERHFAYGWILNQDQKLKS